MLDQQVPDCANNSNRHSSSWSSRHHCNELENNEEHKEFISLNRGLCETWINNTLVYRQDDCVAMYGNGFPASVNIELARAPSEFYIHAGRKSDTVNKDRNACIAVSVFGKTEYQIHTGGLPTPDW